MAVRIRMQRHGRKHRPYFRIVAIDSRQPRDGRFLEELGTYDPMVPKTDDRVKLVPARIKYWLSQGALPSEKCAVLFKAAEPGRLVLLTPAGRRLDQDLVRELANHRRLLLLCGRYEGFDERIRQGLQPLEVSIGDFVCNGGEVPAMVVIDTVIRL